MKRRSTTRWNLLLLVALALATALPHASATILEYHQAVDHPLKRCVTCAAVAEGKSEPKISLCSTPYSIAVMNA